MKRLLQGLALLQVVLLVALGAKAVGVWTTPLPEAGEIPELPAETALPPPKPAPKASPAVTQAIIEHDLFDEQRGQGQDDIVVEGLPETPVPPPSTVKLMGVMVLGGDPVGILLDTNVNPEQQSVRKGDMFGEYQVGDITPSGLLLIGSGGQQFQIPLRVEAASAGAAPVAVAPPPPRTPGTPSPARPSAKPATARPVAPPRPGADAADKDQRAMSARERAQAIAQRNAELRKAGAKTTPAGRHGQPPAEEADAASDPVQARLEALRQLREAAKSR